MSRKNESITLSVDEGQKAQLEAIALKFGCTWGDKPNVSELMKRIAAGKLEITWGDEAPAPEKNAAIMKAIATIQDGLSLLLRSL
jgi:hypothetical protein